MSAEQYPHEPFCRLCGAKLYRYGDYWTDYRGRVVMADHTHEVAGVEGMATP